MEYPQTASTSGTGTTGQAQGSASSGIAGQATQAAQDYAQATLGQARDVLHRADEYVRDNPIPTILGALAIGFALGLMVHHSEPTPRSRWDSVRDRLGDSEDALHDLLAALSKKGKKAYKRGSSALRDAVEEAKDAARDIDVDDYTDPVTNWFRKVWKKAF